MAESNSSLDDDNERWFRDECDDFTRYVWQYSKSWCNTLPEDKRIQSNLKKALNDLNNDTTNTTASNCCRPPDFQGYCVESSFNSEHIRVAVKDFGDLKFPLEPDTVETLSSMSTKAKFGRGQDTLLDLQVRDTQMILASNLKVDIDDVAYSAIVREIATGLNIDSSCTVVPQLYNLLIYGKGQFFERHRDTEKIENMVATLVAVLPSFYEGGQLNIGYGYPSEKHEFSPSYDPDKIKWIAFYPDRYHWIEKVTKGFRVVLTFNVGIKLPSPVTNTLSATGINSKLNKSVAVYFDGPKRPKKLLYLLNYSYSERSLKWHLLKGMDRTHGHALYLVAENQNLVPCLALVVDEELICDHPILHKNKKIMSTIKIRFLVGKDSEQLLLEPTFPIEFAQDREIVYTIRSEKLWKYFEYHGEGFNGNEASKKEFRYHRACVVLCDESLIKTSSTNEKLKSLAVGVVEAVNELADVYPKKTEFDEATNDTQQRKNQKFLVENNLLSSQVVVSVAREGKLSYPIEDSLVKRIISESGDERRQPCIVSPNQVNIVIENEVWDEIFANILSGLNINDKVKLVPNAPPLRLYWSTGGYYRNCDLRYNNFYSRDLKVERGDITLVFILPSQSEGELSIQFAYNTLATSCLPDDSQFVKYLAFFSDYDIYMTDMRKGNCLYLLYNLKLQSDFDLCHEIDTIVVHEPLGNAVEKYFSDEVQPNKLIYLLNHYYSKNSLRWHMLKGSDTSVIYALYAVAKLQNLVPYLAITEIKEHRSVAFSKEIEKVPVETVTETHVELMLLVDEKNSEVEPSSAVFQNVSQGEVCYTLANDVQSKPYKIEKTSLTGWISYYSRAAVVLCAK